MKLLLRQMSNYAIKRYQIASLKKLNSKNEGADFLPDREADAYLSPVNKGLLLDGVDRRLSETNSFQNVCLVAKVGAGKTTKYIIPNVLDRADKNCSMVIHDPKGEVRDLTSGYLKEKGFKIVTFDVKNIENSYFFNPCTEAKNHIELEQIAETIVWSGNPSAKDAFWNTGAIRILSVLLKCLSFGDPKYFNLPNLYHLMQNIGDMGVGLDEWVFENCWDPEDINDRYILNEWKGAMTGNKEAVNSFISVALTTLKSMTNRDIKLFLSKTDFPLSNLRQEKTAIFFITPPSNQKYYSFMTSLFMKSIFNECMREINKNLLPVYVLYDEFGNSYIPDFVSVANTIRGYGVSLSIILQSISQLSLRYSKDEAGAIGGAISTNICLSGSDLETCDYFSKLSGKMTISKASSIDSHSINDYRTEERNLLNPDEVRRMGENEALIISKNLKPIKLNIKPYYKTKKWLNSAQESRILIKRKHLKYSDLELIDL